MSTKLSAFALIDSKDSDVLPIAHETGKRLDFSRSLVDLVNVQVERAPEAAACLGAKGRITYRTALILFFSKIPATVLDGRIWSDSDHIRNHDISSIHVESSLNPLSGQFALTR